MRGFTRQSDNLVYLINCQTCGMMDVGETARTLVTRFTEHLDDIRQNRNKPVAQHFNLDNQTIMDLKVKGLWRVHGDSFERKHMESHIIQRLGTMSPAGMNEKA